MSGCDELRRHSGSVLAPTEPRQRTPKQNTSRQLETVNTVYSRAQKKKKNQPKSKQVQPDTQKINPKIHHTHKRSCNTAERRTMESQTVWCRREGEVGSNTWKGAWTQVQQVRAIRREGRSGGPDWGEGFKKPLGCCS